MTFSLLESTPTLSKEWPDNLGNLKKLANLEEHRNLLYLMPKNFSNSSQNGSSARFGSSGINPIVAVVFGLSGIGAMVPPLAFLVLLKDSGLNLFFSFASTNIAQALVHIDEARGNATKWYEDGHDTSEMFDLVNQREAFHYCSPLLVIETNILRQIPAQIFKFFSAIVCRKLQRLRCLPSQKGLQARMNWKHKKRSSLSP